MLRHLRQNLNSIRRLSLYSALACGFMFTHASINQAVAQNNSPYVVSAKAGGINFVSGDVRLSRAGRPDYQPLTSRDALDSGDVVTTGATGRLEVLLMPGSFLRVAENTQIAFKSATDELQFDVANGTVIVEASGVSDDEALLKVGTPRTVVSLLRSGIYRITVAQDGSTNVAVRKGRAQLALNPPVTIKGNNQATIGGNGGATAMVAKLAKKDVSEFESWSKQRAEQVAVNNRKIQRRALRSTLAGLSADSLFARNRSAFGLWVRDGFTGSYAFLPFYAGWSSPYGSSYRNYLWTGYGYGGYYPYPTRGGNNSGGNGSGNSNPNPSNGGTRANPPGRDFGGRGRSPEGSPSRSPESAPRSFPSRDGGDSIRMRKARPIER